MYTDREIALARAIDRLSGLDLQRFVNSTIHPSVSTSAADKWNFQKSLLEWSDKVVTAAREQETT